MAGPPTTESRPPPRPEMGHVLFMDIVGYSKLRTDVQQRILQELQELVRATEAFCQAQSSDLIRLPTGDGMALVFFGDPEAPARCAVELSRALRSHPEIALRMGLHTGPVIRVADINANMNVAGGGINLAQRVMDCGEAGHILASQALADVLVQLSDWANQLHDLGEVKVKHGVRLRVFNLCTPDAGNRGLPKKIRAARVGPRRRATVVWTLIVLGLVAALLYFGRRAHRLTGRDTVVLADFANSTGDPVFDDTLREGLEVQLQQSPFLSLLPEQRVRQTLKLMGRSPNSRLTPEIVRDVCQRTQCKAYVSGSIATLGSQYVLGLKAVNCQTGDLLAEEQVQAARKEDVLKALDDAARKLRRALGESPSPKFNTPLAQATTPSLEALKAYSLGVKARLQTGDAEAILFYNRAIELDPNFAEAYAGLGVSYFNLGEETSGSKNLQRAYDLRDRTSEREKFSISSLYYSYVTGELEKAIQVYKLWAQSYPRDAVPHANLANLYTFPGRYEEAAAEAREALHLNPDSSIAYVNLMNCYMDLNHLDEAKAVYQQAEARRLDQPFLHLNLYLISFLQGDMAEMGRQVAWAENKQGTEDWLLAFRSHTESFFGRLRKAREFSRRAVESALRNGQKETAAEWQMDAALREAELGNTEQARQDTDAALALSSSRDIRVLAALALAWTGDIVRAQRMATELRKENPLNTIINGYWLPTIDAAIELHRKRPAQAVDALRPASPYELGSPLPQVCQIYPPYVRGEAYLHLHEGGEAGAEFQKLLEHRGIVGNCPLGALAQLGLARAYALQHDAAKTRAAYRDFFALWKGADPDIPALRAAEYTKLK
jgi:eukaryotic-like serine/threonine-protein kinase